jgi:hypothetical protein
VWNCDFYGKKIEDISLCAEWSGDRGSLNNPEWNTPYKPLGIVPDEK